MALKKFLWFFLSNCATLTFVQIFLSISPLGIDLNDNNFSYRQNVEIIDWLGERRKIDVPGKLAAHPNSRFTCPASQCPIIHPRWEDPDGVPIDAIVFGGRRPEGVPLVYESFNWKHGVYVGACCKSEATAAAEHSGKQVMHDPMAMRPFMGYSKKKQNQFIFSYNY